VDPAGGSTVSAATARPAAASSTRRLGRAPRCTAASPAATPAAPAIAASQSATVAVPGVMGTDRRSQGGPAAGPGMGGVIQESRTADVAIMTRMELPIPAPASQVSARVLSIRSA
jgi:hypothetical protein